MLIRAAIAVKNKNEAEVLTNKLIRFSIENEGSDIDIAYADNLNQLYEIYDEIDISFVSYDVLSENLMLLSDIYHKNTSCLTIPMGYPDEGICSFLAVRPAGHLQSAEYQDEISDLCLWCRKELGDNKEVLQLATRQGAYAITVSSICYCQSDQKYVMIVTNSEKKYRKLGKLDDLAKELSPKFLRVHQSFIINTEQVCGIDKSTWEIEMKTGRRIPVSRVYRKTTEEIIKKCIFNG